MPSFFCRSSSSDNSCARGSGRKKKRKKDKFWAINSDTNWPFPRAETRAFRAPTRGARAGTSAVSLQTHREARAAAMVTFEAWGGGWQTEGEGLKKKDREKSVSLKEKGGRERVFFSSLSFFFFFLLSSFFLLLLRPWLLFSLFCYCCWIFFFFFFFLFLSRVAREMRNKTKNLWSKLFDAGTKERREEEAKKMRRFWLFRVSLAREGKENEKMKFCVCRPRLHSLLSYRVF